MKELFRYYDEDFGVSYTSTKKPLLSDYEMHTHDDTEIFYFINGKGTYHVEGSEYTLESGDILVMRPSEAHYIKINPNFKYDRIAINFKTDFFSSIDKESILLKPVNERKAGKQNQYKSYDFETDNYKKYIENIISPVGDKRTNIISNLLPLLNEIYHAYKTRENEEYTNDTTEYQIIRYINKHLTSDINLDTICEKYFISKPQLCRIFKKSTGSTVWQYITIKRLLLAKQMINEGENPTHVFSKCGFNDYSSFYRAFVKNFGYSPKEEKN